MEDLIATASLDHHPPLLRVPQEILIRIAGFGDSHLHTHLTIPELGKFRRTCKHIERQLFDAFAQEFFKKKSFLIEESPLQDLVDISKHPGLRVHLTDLLFDARVFEPQSTLRNIKPDGAMDNGQQFRQTGLARDMLVEALEGLPNLRTISYRDFDSVDPARRFREVRPGREAYWRPRGFSKYELVVDQCGHKLLTILAACAIAGRTPDNLEVFLRNRARLIPESLAMSPRYLDTGVATVLQRLKVLMLSVAFATDRTGYNHGSLPFALGGSSCELPLCRFLLATPNLTRLRLNFIPYETTTSSFVRWLGSNNPDPKLATPTPSFHFLHTLELGKAVMVPAALVTVLTKFKLKKMNLWEITLAHEDVPPNTLDLWSYFLHNLASDLAQSAQLIDIMIGRARQMSSPSYITGSSEEVSFVPEGTAPRDKCKSEQLEVVKFSARHTAKTAAQWLRQLSDLTYVAQMPDEDSSSDSDSGADGDEDGNQDGEPDEDEEDHDDDDDDDTSDDDDSDDEELLGMFP